MPRDLKRIAKDVEKAVESPLVSDKIEVQWNRGVVSTGSTLLDLAISGERLRGGGIPNGIVMEIYGPSGKGKTALLSEICGCAQAKGGDIFIADPEARLDKEYARIYGVELRKDNYSRPDTVPEMFQGIWDWKPKPKKSDAVCVYGGDSLAALSTDMEMEDKDKMGMKRAKDFSEWMRKTCRVIANNGWLIPLTNQIRGGTDGEFTPGGVAIEFYSTIRIRVGSPYPMGWPVVRTVTVGHKEQKEIVGIRSRCAIKKNTAGIPYRDADIWIMFGYGIDDVRGNLQYMKDNASHEITNKKTGEITLGAYNWYPCIDKQIQGLDQAVEYIEKEGHQKRLKDQVIDLWKKIHGALQTERFPKDRG